MEQQNMQNTDELKRLAREADAAIERCHLRAPDRPFTEHPDIVGVTMMMDEVRLYREMSPGVVLGLIERLETAEEARREAQRQLQEAIEERNGATVEARRQNADLLAALKGLASDIQGLISESDGVAGLHLNGDIAPWGELEEGGRFERISHMSDAMAAIAQAEQKGSA